MVSITISVDDKTKKEMEDFSWVNWSKVARDILLDRIKKQEKLERLKKILENSELTEKDIVEFSKKARKGRFKELKKNGLV